MITSSNSPTKGSGIPNHYVGDLLRTMAISGRSRVRTELFELTVIPAPAPHPVQMHRQLPGHRYLRDLSSSAQGGARLALEIVDGLHREFHIDERRIYIAGNSMGGAGAWNALAHRPNFFAAAVICCGGQSPDDGSGSPATPLWDFHGEADEVVPVSSSRDRIAARRKAGGHPIYTEYAGVDHDGATRLAFTEPELPVWVFSQRRG
jgi:dienelactone hydrolase